MSKTQWRIRTGIVGGVVGGCVGFLLDIIATMTIGLPLMTGLWLVAAAAVIGFILGVLLGGRRGG